MSEKDSAVDLVMGSCAVLSWAKSPRRPGGQPGPILPSCQGWGTHDRFYGDPEQNPQLNESPIPHRMGVWTGPRIPRVRSNVS